MNQPIRWLDDARTDNEVRELLSAGSRPPPFPQMLLVSTALALTPKAALAANSLWSSTALLALKATGAGLVIGLGSIAAVTAVASPTWLEHPTPRATTNVSTKVPSESLSVDHDTSRDGDDHEEPAPITVSAPPPAVEARMATAPAAAEPSGVEASAKRSGIAAEAELLEQARSQLAISPSRALKLTAQHEHEFAQGQLLAERELIAVDALLRLGRNAEAERRAAPLLSDASNQVFAERLRNLLVHHQK